ncbi:unnamed protein product [Miscanthus lutarioriparius]|uniref:BED-type domain-containing protein n=1 Tax=Miscanthus lutarioriparius TaxID=422564 RepID=A0A811QI38_9POAL|nr:unnamed protein product [Miscanthus lutarioriparius]
MEDDANFQLDPWELPPYFLLRKNKWKSLRTHSGYWKEREDEFIAIRSGDDSSSSCSPSYHGVRRTLEFYLNDGTGGEGTKTDWLIHDYQHLRKDEAGAALLLEEDVVLRKVFMKDNVWKHFTKIRTNDPDVVYAACHHCDKVLRAHPKKQGTSRLPRHRNSAKCRSSCNNPSTDEDREMLHRLRTVLDPYNQQKIEGKLECQEVNANLTQLNPWVLGNNACYVTTSLNWQTNEGCWEEIDKEFTAIRTEQQQMQGFWKDIDNVFTAIQIDYQMQMQVPQYMGLRRTLEFHLNQNGNMLKTAWIMLEFKQGDMVIRKVFRYDKDAVTAIFSDLDRRLNGDNDTIGYYNGEGVNMDSTLSSDYMHGKSDTRGKRTAASNGKSEVWMHFTKVYSADRGVVYAVCHVCDRGYNGHSKNGTSHLWRHNKSCANKCCRTENANDATTEWEAEIWPLFLVWKNYGGRDLCSFQIKDIFSLFLSISHQGRAEARSTEDGPGWLMIGGVVGYNIFECQREMEVDFRE